MGQQRGNCNSVGLHALEDYEVEVLCVSGQISHLHCIAVGSASKGIILFMK